LPGFFSAGFTERSAVMVGLLGAWPGLAGQSADGTPTPRENQHRADRQRGDVDRRVAMAYKRPFRSGFGR